MVTSKTDKAIWKWLKALGFNISYNYLKEQLNINEDYPSLRGISKTLTKLEIEHAAIKIERNDLLEVPLPFLARLTGTDPKYMMISSLKQIEKQRQSFFTHWTGLLLLAERPAIWHNGENEQQLKKEQLTKRQQFGFAAGFIIISVLSMLNTFTYTGLALLLIAYSGIFISWRIIDMEKGSQNLLTMKICNASDDCNKVLNSTYATFINGLKWSDISLISFSTLLLFLLSAFLTTDLVIVFTTIAISNVLSIPVLIFSVYYQRQIIKSWCKFCLIIDALLLLQFFTVMPYLFHAPWKLFSYSLFLLACMLATVFAFAWIKIKALITKNSDFEIEAFAHQQLLNKVEVFETLLKNAPKISKTTWPGDIQLGLTRSKIAITVVVNPMCSTCEQAYKALLTLVEKYETQLTIRFKLNSVNKEEEPTRVTEYLLQQFALANEGTNAANFLANWFKEMNFERYKNKYPLSNHVNVDDILERNYNWVQGQGIDSSPAIYINEHKLPKYYKLEHLDNLVNGLLLKPAVH